MAGRPPPKYHFRCISRCQKKSASFVKIFSKSSPGPNRNLDPIMSVMPLRFWEVQNRSALDPFLCNFDGWTQSPSSFQ
jgi:hypothetical protein